MRITGLVWIGLITWSILTPTASMTGQGLIVDQASGSLNDLVQQFSEIPRNSIAQSFTPSFSEIGYVQFRVVVPAPSLGETVVINLRQNAYNGPIVGSTTPVLLINLSSQFITFYFAENVPITPNQFYFLEPLVLSGGTVDVGYKFPSSYPWGEAWNNGVPSGDASDYWFREGIVGVPEPATVWLGLLSTAVLVGRRWIRGRP